jgi:hypothetical protein
MGVFMGNFEAIVSFVKSPLSDTDDLIVCYQKLTDFLTDLDETQNRMPRSVVQQPRFS